MRGIPKELEGTSADPASYDCPVCHAPQGKPCANGRYHLPRRRIARAARPRRAHSKTS